TVSSSLLLLSRSPRRRRMTFSLDHEGVHDDDRLRVTQALGERAGDGDGAPVAVAEDRLQVGPIDADDEHLVAGLEHPAPAHPQVRAALVVLDRLKAELPPDLHLLGPRD